MKFDLINAITLLALVNGALSAPEPIPDNQADKAAAIKEAGEGFSPRDEPSGLAKRAGCDYSVDLDLGVHGGQVLASIADSASRLTGPLSIRTSISSAPGRGPGAAVIMAFPLRARTSGLLLSAIASVPIVTGDFEWLNEAFSWWRLSEEKLEFGRFIYIR
ncbi:hypothetical protein VTL71DRAFT_7327 [Oculimacula yallundae]|uniref:Uncharacterized protein n=1 Tax=Oculimacula yallundae TaxID=86028 RepID=A0ABR4BWC9_9HELO